MTTPIKVTVEAGRLVIPEGDLTEYGLKEGDELWLITTNEGVLIGTRQALGNKILDEMAENFKKAGITTEELNKEGQIVREALYQETYPPKAE